MSSTNKTQNYELSQYVGADKPTYLGDYNSDMLKIDTQMKNNADNIASVGATATTANATANTALADAGTAQTTADNANTSASNASAIATQALSKANANETAIATIISKEVYSNEEKIVGTWFGKPLYRKDYNITTITNQSEVILDNLTNVEFVKVIGQAKFEYATSGVFYSRALNVYDATMGNARTTWETDAPNLKYTRANYNSSYNLRGVRASAYYIKTTD